ncbi:hypothetical protein WJX77_010045 [Trebouxia sp. C0004]
MSHSFSFPMSHDVRQLHVNPADSYVFFDQVQSESILGQLSVTTAELRELKSRQQQLEARNMLLEKVAELNTVQQSGNWGVRLQRMWSRHTSAQMSATCPSLRSHHYGRVQAMYVQKYVRNS